LLCAYDLDKHQTMYNTYGRNKHIYEQICIQVYIYIYICDCLSVNLGVYCSSRDLLLIQ
jgi:hypothetical protein